jgi:hypothetical protein
VGRCSPLGMLERIPGRLPRSCHLHVRHDEALGESLLKLSN